MVARQVAVVGLMACGLVAACGDDGGAQPVDGVVEVVASFYPLAYVTQRVGGLYVNVSNLTPPGVEPHDLELSGAQVAAVADADLVVYLEGFSPAVDDAVDTSADGAAMDVSGAADLDDSGDPHFWLDPTRLARVVDAVADRLGDLNPSARAQFRENAQSLRADLDALDAQYMEGLRECASRDLVTSHEAFGYLAARYELEQMGIAGTNPEAEPTPGALADATRFVNENDVQTIYAETLASTNAAQAVAAETGAAVAVLDPLEGLGAGSGGDYLAVMRTNLVTLRGGQRCT